MIQILESDTIFSNDHSLIAFADSKQAMVEEINALDLLKEELTTEEVHLKVNAIHRMKTVILSIGPGETS